MTSEEYVSILQTYYLNEFVPSGGSFVKFIIGDAAYLSDFRAQLSSDLRDRFLIAFASANDSPLHPLSDTVFQIAKQIDWRTFAQRFLTDILQRDGWTDSARGATLESLAKQSGLTPIQCSDRIERLLAEYLYNREGLLPEFRHAFAALVRACLEPSDYSKIDAERIALDWLTGNLKFVQQSKPLHIHKRITILNARGVLVSICRLARAAGFEGTLLYIDFSAYVTHSPGRRRYAPPHVMDFYETLRQFVDSIDELRSTVLLFFATPNFVGESRFSFRNYEALRLRLTNEAFASGRQNALAPLIQLEDRLNVE